MSESDCDLLILTYERSNTPSRRFRIEAYLPFMRMDGFHVKVVGLSNGIIKRIYQLLRLPKAKTLLLQKKLLHKTEWNLLSLRYSVRVFDFDDAIYLSEKNKERFKHILSNSSTVIAGNSILANYAMKLNSNTRIIPTGLDISEYKKATFPKKNEAFRIGWIGTSENVKYLNILATVVSRLSDRGYTFIYVCNKKSEELDSNGWNFLEWSKEKERDIIASFHLGIMPLPNDEWTRGKCSFKLLQYMAAGLPCAASPVGMNCDLLSGSAAEMLCDNIDEWINIIERYKNDYNEWIRASEMCNKIVLEYDLKRLYMHFKQIICTSLQDIS